MPPRQDPLSSPTTQKNITITADNTAPAYNSPGGATAGNLGIALIFSESIGWVDFNKFSLKRKHSFLPTTYSVKIMDLFITKAYPKAVYLFLEEPVKSTQIYYAGTHVDGVADLQGNKLKSSVTKNVSSDLANDSYARRRLQT